jgi:transcriptional regulator with XRE-family HTH domain
MDAPTTGIDELDSALGGLFWGDNVVWEVDDATALAPYYTAASDSADAYDYAAYVALGERHAIRRRFPRLDVIDAGPGGPFDRPGALLSELRRRCVRGRRNLVLFDPLDVAGVRWGRDIATRFFTRACPALLEIGAIAYWHLDTSTLSREARQTIRGVTQCVVDLSGGHLRIVKAEGRPSGIEGSVYRRRVESGRPALTLSPSAARLGRALLAIRHTRGLSQRDLGLMAGVSASAISQAERGLRGLSLETVLELAGALGLSLDEFLRGEIPPGYRLARVSDLNASTKGQPLPLLDDPRLGLRVQLLRIRLGESVELGLAHDGLELVAVAEGLVQVDLATGQPTLRQGEALLAEGDRVLGCRNVSDREALVFWVLRDEAARPGSAWPPVNARG